MKNNVITSASYGLLIIGGMSLPLTCVAEKAPSTAELWRLVQKQQSQIEQQNLQIEQQNKTISTMKSDIDTQISASKEAILTKNDALWLDIEKKTKKEKESPFSFKGYAVANYFNYDWDTHPDKRHEADLERFVIGAKYKFNDQWSLHAEVEYEHGGTGSTMEFDVFEEFGEFEQEVEKGGEIVLEELFVQFDYKPWLSVRMGEIPVPIGLINKRHRPSQYYTTERSEGESAMIPVAWHELGIELRGKYKGFFYRGQVITGLDSTGFSSANWVKRGFQKRFERKNADNLAFVASLDYDFSSLNVDFLKGLEVGSSFYWGNTSNNRPKPDLKEEAEVTIVGFHGLYERGPVTVRASSLYGHLRNSDLVSKANSRLPNNLGAKRTPVARNAFAWSVEAGVDLFQLIPNKPSFLGHSFDWFVRYDNYDTMRRVTENSFDNPRWEREVWTTGFNYSLTKGVMLKGQYAHRSLNIPEDNAENTYSLGVAAEF